MLVIAFLFGMQSGIVFDIGRALRGLFLGEVRSKKIKKLYAVKRPFSTLTVGARAGSGNIIIKNALIFLCDLFCVIYLFFGLVLINYSYNNGGIRAFTVVGLIFGFVIYYFTASKIVIFLTEFVAFSLRFAFFAIFGVISLPFIKIYNNLVKKVKKRWENIRFRLAKKRKKVYNVSEEVYRNPTCGNSRIRVKISVAKSNKNSVKRSKNN